MSGQVAPNSGNDANREGDDSRVRAPSAAKSERRIPFLLRVAAVWTDVAELPQEDDGQLRYWRRAPLTGNVVTSEGRDVEFSDLEVR